MNTASEILSYVISIIFLGTLLGIAIGNAIFISRKSASELRDIKDDYPTIQAIYELIRTTSKMALAFQTVYIGRRVFLSIVLVFFTNTPIGQAFAMMLASLGNLIYLLRYKPFEEYGI